MTYQLTAEDVGFITDQEKIDSKGSGDFTSISYRKITNRWILLS